MLELYTRPGIFSCRVDRCLGRDTPEPECQTYSVFEQIGDPRTVVVKN